MTELRFYVHHIRAADICMQAARSYFVNRNWSWSDFLTYGRPLSDLTDQGDEYAMRVAAIVKKEAGQ